MAKKRMFNSGVLDTDAFLDMPLSAQALYFHLNLRADDDGFIGNPKRITMNIGASLDDLRLLVLKRFVIAFADGVIVIKHWRMHNVIKKDRYTETNYKEDLALLDIKENGAYTIRDGAQLEPIWSANGAQMEHLSSADIGRGLDKVKDQSKVEVEDKVKDTEIKDFRKSNNKHSFDSEFESVWSKYPKKQGKQDAFNKARASGISLEEIENGLDQYLFYIEKTGTDTRYIKNGSTWFNQHCWDDDYTVVEREPQDARYMTKGEQAAKDLKDGYEMTARWVEKMEKQENDDQGIWSIG